MATIITNTDIGANLGFAGSPLKLVAREQLRGNNYIVVYGNNNTVEQNGIELASKLNFAKISTPNGLPLSETNRMTVLVAPGVYHLAFFINWLEMDTPYIDLVSLTGDADVFLTSLNSATAIKVTSSDIKIKGFNLDSQHIIIENAYSNNYFENIIGGDYNFSNGNSGGFISGNFKNCEGKQSSFANASNNESLVFSKLENCIATDFSFGYDIIISTLTNCSSLFGSFGYMQISDSYLTNCTSREDSFGCENGIYGSTLTNCTADGFSFGRNNVPGQTTSIENSILNNCKAGNNSFGVINRDDSTFTNCIGGNECFGANSANATYKNCKGDRYSFGAGQLSWPDLIAGGNFYNCEAGVESFGTNFSNGNYSYCIAENNSFRGITQGGMGGYAAYCKGMNPTGLGTAIYCTDATNNPVNYGLGSTTNNI
jgi:hypothetical protein